MQIQSEKVASLESHANKHALKEELSTLKQEVNSIKDELNNFRKSMKENLENFQMIFQLLSEQKDCNESTKMLSNE